MDENRELGNDFVDKFIRENKDPSSVIQFILTKQGSKDLQKALTTIQENSTLVEFLV